MTITIGQAASAVAITAFIGGTLWKFSGAVYRWTNDDAFRKEVKFRSQVIAVSVVALLAPTAPFAVDAYLPQYSLMYHPTKKAIPKPARAKFKGFTGGMMGSNTKTQMIKNMAS